MPPPAPTRRPATELTLTRSATRRGSLSAARSRCGSAAWATYSSPLRLSVDHPVPLLDRGVDDRAEQHHAGVVDHGVEPAELLRGALHGGDRLLAVGDVGLDREPADLGGEGVEPVLAARGDGHRRPLCGERPRRRLADPAAGARDERDRVLEFVAHAAEV